MGDRRDDLHQGWMLKNMREKAASKAKEVRDEEEAKREAAEDDADDGGAAPAAAPAPPAAVEAEAAPRQPADRAGDDRPRVLAYSDSESDVESHIQRVKDHLGSNKQAKAAAEAAAAAAAADAEAEATAAAAALAASHSAQRAASAVRQLGRAAGGAAAALRRHVTPGVALRAAALLGARHLHPAAGDGLDIAALAAMLIGVAAGHVGGAAGAALPPRARAARAQLIDLGKGAALATAAHLARRAAGRLRRARAPRVERLLSTVDVSALEEAVHVDPDKPPETATEWAAVYAPELREMRRMLDECRVALPGPRFEGAGGGAELLRFAAACGLLEAAAPQARAAAVECAVRRLIETADWTRTQTFLPDAALRKWRRVVAWRGADAGGRPVLVVRLGRALQLYQGADRLDELAQAIASQVAAGVAERLSGGASPAEQLVAVVDCRETSSWGALLLSRRALAVIRRLAADLAAHYPGRLHRLHLLELPLLARVGVQAALAPLSEATRAKVVNASADDGALPVTVALLQRRRSHARGLGLQRSASLGSLATSDDCSTPRRGHSPARSAPSPGSPSGLSAQVKGEEGPGEARAEDGGATGLAPRPSPFVQPPQGPPAAAAGQQAAGDDRSPLTADIATNLLPALDAARDSAQSGRSAPGGAGAAPASHFLPMTPSMMSPRPTEEEEEALRATAEAEEAAEAQARTPEAAAAGAAAPAAGAGPGAGGPSPWNGLAAMLSAMGTPPVRGGASGRPSPRAHRLSALSRESSYGAATPTSAGPGMLGGLTDLPPRPSTARKTPAKSSLRRARSQEPARPTGPLGSHPLRRQTSVSWAEELERIREIRTTPPASRLSHLAPAWEEPQQEAVVPAAVPASPTGAAAAAAVLALGPAAGGQAAEEEPLSMPLVMLLLLCAGVLQRVLLGVAGL